MISLKENVLLAPYTIYKIGGPARFFVEVKNSDELREALTIVKEKHLKFVVLGAGSNVLVSDSGFDGMVIRMTGGEVRVEGERMRVDAGMMMARAVAETGRAGLHGFEWGIGVPGTIGGSIRGNAGCFGGEMKDLIESVEVFDVNTGLVTVFSHADCQFGYRDSIFKTHPEWIILSGTLKLSAGEADAIGQEIRRITQERIAKQDIGSKCCGCIFKNAPWPAADVERDALCAKFPELAQFRNRATIPSAFLIDQVGLKGEASGSVCISDKHANFFINNGAGTSSDVMKLIALTKEKVKEKYEIDLHEEIYFIGF